MFREKSRAVLSAAGVALFPTPPTPSALALAPPKPKGNTQERKWL